MSRRMDCAVSDSLGGVLPYHVYATLVIRACSVTLVHTCRDDCSIDCRVHGNRTLYAEARPYHHKLLLSNYWFRVLLPRGDVEGGNSEALLMVITTYYYTMLQQLLLHCYFISVDINCWLILTPCCKTSSEDASLR